MTIGKHNTTANGHLNLIVGIEKMPSALLYTQNRYTMPLTKMVTVHKDKDNQSNRPLVLAVREN